MRTRTLAAMVLACAAWPGVAAESTVGRLFFSPEDRLELEKRRFAPPPAPPRAEAPAQAVPTPPAPPPAPEYSTINGHVLRSSGHSTTWVNGAPRYDQFRVEPEALRLPLATRKASVPVKVGETLEARSGQKTDPLAGGSVRVHPAR